MRPRHIAAVLVAAIATLIFGCGDGSEQSGRPIVVATTTQVGDFVRNVGAGRVEVHQILKPNSDPHGYEPRPSDVKALTDASVVVQSGGDVDEWLDQIIDQSGASTSRLNLIDVVRTRDGGHAHEGGEHEEDEVDPHWWQDPRNVELAVKAIRRQLIAADPAGRATYERNASRYLAAVARLDESTAKCIAKLPVSERQLVTSHDALGYYADRYGLHIVGTVLPSLSTQAQPSAKDITALVDEIRRTKVKAIFPESSLNPKLERAVASESGAETGGALWADSLGPSGSSGATYLDSIASNTEAIVHGLSGGTIACRPTA